MGWFDKPQPSIDRYVGGDAEEQKAAQNTMRHVFDEQKFERMKPFELPKTPEIIKIIEIVGREVDKLREQYGLEPYRIPTKNYHLISKEGAKELGRPAAFSSRSQALAFQEPDSKLELVNSLLHETIHFKSFASMDVIDGAPFQRRLGLTSREGNNKLFESLNEAVTEMLVKRVMKTLEESFILADEAPLIQEVRARHGDDIAFKAKLPKEDGTLSYFWIKYSYEQERQALNLLIDKLVERNPDAGKDHEAWFDMFASGMFTGHLLEIARTVEKTFGQGTFRKLGEPVDGAAFLAYVESL